MKLIGELGVRETGMLASISDYHTFHKFKPGGRAQAATYLDAVRMALDAGIRPRLHLEDATRAPMDFMLAFIEAVRESERSDPANCARSFACATRWGWVCRTMMWRCHAAFRASFEPCAAGLPPEDLEFHPHNDTWLVVANCLAAIREGCGAINGASLGKGERTGNAPLEAVLLHLIGMGFFAERRPDFTALNELAELYARWARRCLRNIRSMAAMRTAPAPASTPTA